jgi:TonB family protein
MKSLALLTSFILIVPRVSAETQTRRDATYVYREDELQWDKSAFDRPPQILGGHAALVRQLSYPADLRARRVEGSARVTVSVDASGRASSLSFSPRMPPDLERLVTYAVRACRWKPGQRRGTAVSGRVWFPATFVAPKRYASPFRVCSVCLP